MVDELDNFLEDQKAKIEQERAELEKDPPYMEIKSKRFEKIHEVDKLRDYTSKENIPPNRPLQNESLQMKQIGVSDIGYGLSLPLGEEYERKKHKLKEELRQDYRRYLNQGNAQAKRKKHLRSTGEVDPNTQGMSLPIGERLSAKEKLRLERNQEYNQFLRMKEEELESFRLAAAAVQYPQGDKSRVRPEPYLPAPMYHRDQDDPKKDAYNSMEAYEQLLNKRRSEAERRNRRDTQTETDDRFVGRMDDEITGLNKKQWRSDIDAGMIHQPRCRAPDWEGDRRLLRINLASDGRFDADMQERKPLRENLRTERDGRDREPPVDYEDDFREHSNRRPISSITKSRPKLENLVQPAERSKSANIKEEYFSTGLILGGADKDEAQKRRKERYREELMEQMAEQQRNKRREKELELKVAATGAIDPEKQPDRLRQFGAINRQQEMTDRNVPYRPGVLIDPQKTSRRGENKVEFEEKTPPERPKVAFQTPVPDPAFTGNSYPVPFNPAHEQFHRGLSSSLGEIVAPRIAAVPPPQPPVLAENYRTPYDDAYYYYGARNPLDPSLAYYPPDMGLQCAPLVSMPAMYVSQTHPGEYNVDSKQRAGGGRGASLGLFPEQKPRQTKEAVQSYQEDLEQQIRERNERIRKDKEERERYEAKLEAEIKNYNPWGRGGGGAPLKDSKGNLITDLKRMHKLNEDAYQNPALKASEDKRADVAVDTSLADNTSSTTKIPGFSFANTSPFARGSIFAEPPSEQQVQQQESYKNFLRQQIEEKRRKEEAEREKIRLEEEREERHIAEQRAKILREYEEEKNRQKLKDEEQRQTNEELAEERRREAERKRKEEEAKKEEELKRYYEQERAKVPEKQERPQRQTSPLIPTLQHKVSSHVPRPPTAESEVSIQSHVKPQSRTASPPVPARKNQLRAYDEKKSVINELSELRKQLRSEQRRLEGRLQDTDQDDESVPSMSSRKREKNSADVFDLARQKLQAAVRRPSLKALDSVNMQNIRDFNDLKYRDTETREGVRYMYPDPPKDDQTLEIQQQALLREQQRNLNRMKRRTAMQDDFDHVPAHSLRHPGLFKDPPKDLMKTSLLESESAFIGENGEPYAAFTEPYSDLPPLPSARERRRHKFKPLEFENEIPPVPPIPLHQPDRFSVNSASSFNVDEVRVRNEERLRRLSHLQKSTTSTDDDPSDFGNAEDILRNLPPKPVDRPHSVDTVATDPWLRPGTSETLKRFIAGHMNHDTQTNDNTLTFNWQGLSTAHG